MRLIVHLLIVLLAVTSLQLVNVQDYSVSSEQMDSLRSLPQWDLNSLQTAGGKSASKIDRITQTSVIFSEKKLESRLEEIRHSYYTPIYSLYRAKEYFLLI